MQRNQQRILNQAGMTLIEIMIVLIIIATMGTFLVSRITGQFGQAKIREAKILVSEIVKNLDQFNLDCGFYPTTEQGLAALTAAPTGGRTCPNYLEPYRRKIPMDPWGHELSYESDGTKFVLKSLGKDGKPGGEKENADISSED